jgi:uncharacterized protein (TIGR01777 family)
VRIAVTGASGLIGSALVPTLHADGHEVLRLVRREPRAADEASWQPSARRLDPAVLAGAGALIHLAGAGVGDRPWTAGYRRTIRASREDGTAAVSAAVAAAGVPVLLSASAVGWYGDTGDTPVDETAPAGGGFLADVVRRWEAATEPARAAGVRVVHLRTGVVLSRDGGALGRVLPLFRLGLGARLGSGRQYVSFISLVDELRAIRFLLDAVEVAGAVNLTAPAPVTNADYTRALARALHRPAPFAVPAAVLTAVLGDFAREALLAGQRVLPRRLTEAGFGFEHPDVESAVRAALAD